MKEEKRKILEMVKDGKITLEEAEQLLDKLNVSETTNNVTKIKKPNSKKVPSRACDRRR